MDLNLIDMYLPKLYFRNGNKGKLVHNRAFLIFSMIHSVLFCKEFQLFSIFYFEYKQCAVSNLTLSQCLFPGILQNLLL